MGYWTNPAPLPTSTSWTSDVLRPTSPRTDPRALVLARWLGRRSVAGSLALVSRIAVFGLVVSSSSALASDPEEATGAGVDSGGPAEPSPTTDTTDGAAPPFEIVVVGEEAVEEARRALIAALGRQGWHLRKQKSDGTLVFKSEQAWKGAVLVGEQGSVRTRRPVVYGTPGFPVVAFNLLPSKKKLHGARKAVVAGVQPELTALHEALQEAAMSDRLAELPARLDALWSDGTPLGGGEPLPDLASRRAAVLDFWASRTETDDGRAVQEVVSDWLRAVVMTSDSPLTDQEIAEAEARRDDGARVLGEQGG